MSPNEKAIRIPLNLPNINVEYKTNIKENQVKFDLLLKVLMK